LELIVGLVKNSPVTLAFAGIFCRERIDMSVFKSGETCDVSGIYKAHCVHALERSFSKGQNLPRCERCRFDILWVLVKPELLERNFLISNRTTDQQTQQQSSAPLPVRRISEIFHKLFLRADWLSN